RATGLERFALIHSFFITVISEDRGVLILKENVVVPFDLIQLEVVPGLARGQAGGVYRRTVGADVEIFLRQQGLAVRVSFSDGLVFGKCLFVFADKIDNGRDRWFSAFEFDVLRGNRKY